MNSRFILGDCFAVLPTLDAGSVQTCVTSPPYHRLRSYLDDGHQDKAREIGSERDLEEYVVRMVSVFRSVRRVLRDDGTLWLNLGDRYGPCGLELIPHRVAMALQADGWRLRSAIVWTKPNPMPESVKNRPTSAYEMVFLFVKSASYFYDAAAIQEPLAQKTLRPCGVERPTRRDMQTDKGAGGSKTLRIDPASGRNARNVWTIAPKPFHGAHYAVMPPELAERCIRAGTSGRGGCPHCGAPWVRVVQREADSRRPYKTEGAGMKAAAAGRGDGAGARKVLRLDGAGGDLATIRRVHIGWAPSCACPAHEPVPQLVLDPFGGAGTTALAARNLDRFSVSIELDPASIVLAEKRLADAPRQPSELPLFAALAAE